MKTPKFTIVTIGFNVSHVVTDMVLSVLNQNTDVPFEYLYVDDCSTDNSIQVVESVLADNLRGHISYKIVRNPVNLGINGARNAGVTNASTEYILICDSDDVLDPSWADLLFNTLINGASFVCGELVQFGPAIKSGQPRALIVEVQPKVKSAPTCGGGNIGFTRTAYNRIGGFPPEFPRMFAGKRPAADDTSFCWYMYLAGIKLVRCSDAIIQYRQPSGMVAVVKQQLAYGMGAHVIECLFYKSKPKLLMLLRDCAYIVAGIVFVVPIMLRHGYLDWLGRISRRLGCIVCLLLSCVRSDFRSTYQEYVKRKFHASIPP